MQLSGNGIRPHQLADDNAVENVAERRRKRRQHEGDQIAKIRLPQFCRHLHPFRPKQSEAEQLAQARHVEDLADCRPDVLELERASGQPAL